MEILWRGDEYDFTPRTIQGGGDKETRFSNVDAPIFGADTESVQLTDRYEPQCFTFSSESRDDLVYLSEECFALKKFLEWIIGNYADELLEAGSAFIYFHNLEYDWLQLVKNDARLLEMARIGVGLAEDLELFRIGAYRVTLKKDALFTGSAPHFTIRIALRRGGFNLFFRDTFSFFPGSLAKVSKDLGLDKKLRRQDDLGLRDYRREPAVCPDCNGEGGFHYRSPHGGWNFGAICVLCQGYDNTSKAYFEEYAKKDANNTRGIGEAIRELHRVADMQKLRASSPSYAIARVFHLMGEDRSIVTGDFDQRTMQLIFDTYRGGRTGGIYHGKIDGVAVLDFHSSYPASMCSLPSFSPNMAYVRLDDLRLENVLPILEETGNVFLRISGEETDAHYPAIITTHDGKLTPIYGRFENIATTGVELMVGLKSGTLKDVTIHEAVVLLDMDDDPYLPFREFALAAYKRKAESPKGSVMYTSAKLELNSAYGKLIESRTQTLIGASDYKTHFPYIEGMEKDFGNYYYKHYVDAVAQGKRLDDIYESVLDEIIENFDEAARRDMRDKMFGDFSISGRIYGRYVIPAAASLITATSRARLCAAMKALGALYWDTDSVFVARPSVDPDEVNADLAQTDAWLPKNVRPLRIGEELGDLDCEIEGASGWLAGIKRYYLRTPGGKVKAATHGIPALPKQKTRDVIEALATGTSYKYESKPKPMKAKEAKSVEEIGSFRSGRFVSKYHLDDRLTWDGEAGSHVGAVKPFAEMGVKELTDEQYQKHLEKLYKKELAYDPIRESCLSHGFIRVVDPGERYRGEYEALSRSTKAKYFRRSGLPIDEWADSNNMSVAELFDKLNSRS